MAKKKSSELKKQVDELLDQGVTSKEKFRAALPMMSELRASIASTKEWLVLLQGREKLLSEAAATYAVDHATALDQPLAPVKDGIESGSITIDGVEYGLTLSLDKAKRLSGGNFTKSFLEGLPKEFTASELKLVQSSLAGLSADELARYDLKRDLKRVWSIA